MTDLESKVIPMDATMEAMEEVAKANVHPAVKVAVGVAVAAVTVYTGVKLYKARKNKKAEAIEIAPEEPKVEKAEAEIV